MSEKDEAKEVDEAVREIMKELAPLLSGFNDVMRNGIKTTKPLVEQAIRRRETDEDELCRLFDSLLTYVTLDEGLTLFKRFARYVYSFNPQLAYDYIMIYKDTYDSDEDEPDEDD
ncbi:MAG: hypothetical protein LBQ80_05165 [Clostridium sp.]|nr:hypothetical protein [Clostridium sp.]